MSSGPRDDDYSDALLGSGMGPDSPACDTCHEKKAKCEKPRCANCIAAGTPCGYSEYVRRDIEAGRSEQQSNEVNERLSRLEDTMGRILGLLEGGTVLTPSTTAPPSVADTAPPTPTRAPVPPEDPQYDGPTGLPSPSTAAATDAATVAPLHTSITPTTPTATTTTIPRTHLTRGARKPDDALLPPREEAQVYIDAYFTATHNCFPILCEAQFRGDVERMYTHKARISEGKWMSCFYNVLLFGLYSQHTGAGGDADTEERDMKIKRYYYIAWRTLDSVEKVVSNEKERVQALLMAAISAMETSRPWLALTLLRYAGIGNLNVSGSPENTALFWSHRILSTTLAATLGQFGYLRQYGDSPIATTSQPQSQTVVALAALATVLDTFENEFHMMQGRLTLGWAQVLELQKRLESWWEDWRPLIFSRDSLDSRELRFAYHNTKALLYRRAVSVDATRVADEAACLGHARAALKTLTAALPTAIATMSATHTHTHPQLWLCTYYPFTSYFILFTELIRHPQSPTVAADLALMSAMARYLRWIGGVRAGKEGGLQGTRALVRVAKAFRNVAVRYLQARGQKGGWEVDEMGEGGQVDSGVEAPWPTAGDPAPAPLSASDLEIANFLSWTPSAHRQGQKPTYCDWAAMVLHPSTFQAKMEDAARLGEVEFDWFGWEGWGGWEEQIPSVGTGKLFEKIKDGSVDGYGGTGAEFGQEWEMVEGLKPRMACSAAEWSGDPFEF